MLAASTATDRIEGIDGRTPRRSVVHQLAHWLFQKPYTHLGREFPSFSAYLSAGREIRRRQGLQFDLAMIRQCLTLALLDACDTLPDHGAVLIIGDGYGSMALLLRRVRPNLKVVLVNLRRPLAADLAAVESVPGSPVEGVTADDADSLKGRQFDLVINIASMQEMDPPEIARYFDIVRSSPRGAWFYCCNRESKTLPDGTVASFDAYPWGDQTVLVDELCPWHQDFYAFRPPFYRPFDGPIRHRLVRFPKH